MFSKCADFMEEGRRLENLSWRLWNRETFCVPLELQQQQQPQQKTRRPSRVRPQDTKELPELSTSVDSAASDTADQIESHIKCPPRSFDCRPAIVSEESILSISRGREKHFTSTDLEKMVHNIKEKKDLEPLEVQQQTQSNTGTRTTLDITPRASSPSPASKPEVPAESEQSQKQPEEQVQQQQPTQQPSQPQQSRPQPPPVRQHQSSESCSTVPLDGNESEYPQAAASDTSVSSAGIVKSPSVVRGFSPSHVSSSYRSQPRLPSATESSKTTRPDMPSPLKKQKKGGMFTLGSSSGDEGSSFDDRAGMMKPQRSSLTDGLNRGAQPPSPPKNVALFKPEAETMKAALRESVDAEDAEDAIETDDDEEISESAIEDDDSSSEWEDSITENGDANGVDPGDDDEQEQFDEGQLFQRVDSRPNLVSRPSLLTMMMHQPQRNGAPHSGGRNGGTWSVSTPALQRSQLPSTNGQQQHHSAASSSPEDDDENTLTMKGPEVPRSRPIVAKPIPCRSVAHSPRTTRRNMLATELTESLRRHLLMERQQKTTSATQPFKRRHTAHDMANLQEYPGPGPVAGRVNGEQLPATGAARPPRHSQTSKNNSWNHYFDCGPWEYHEKGW